PVYSSNIDVEGATFTDEQMEDIMWIAKLICAEARNQPYAGKVAVGAVVMNRVKRNKASIYDVIFAHSGDIYQFAPVKIGTIYNTPTEQCIQAAKEAFLGGNPVGDAYYFTASKTDWVATTRTFICKIGDHSFYK
ncbi:MAG TPA: cell wall hydrolase, partial [Clostridia bacterium]|nr:cell wall hydrolase [Clostridia bacterium]